MNKLSFFVLLLCCSLLPLSALGVSLTDPLGTPDAITLITRVIRVVLGMVGIVAVLFIIYGGLQMLLSAGSPEKVKKGQDTLIWAVIGIVLIFSSYGIAQAVFQTLQGQAIETSPAEPADTVDIQFGDISTDEIEVEDAAQ